MHKAVAEREINITLRISFYYYYSVLLLALNGRFQSIYSNFENCHLHVHLPSVYDFYEMEWAEIQMVRKPRQCCIWLLSALQNEVDSTKTHKHTHKTSDFIHSRFFPASQWLPGISFLFPTISFCFVFYILGWIQCCGSTRQLPSPTTLTHKEPLQGDEVGGRDYWSSWAVSHKNNKQVSCCFPKIWSARRPALEQFFLLVPRVYDVSPLYKKIL